MPKRSFNFGKENEKIESITVNQDGTATILFKDKTAKKIPFDWADVNDFETRTKVESEKKQ